MAVPNEQDVPSFLLELGDACRLFLAADVRFGGGGLWALVPLQATGPNVEAPHAVQVNQPCGDAVVQGVWRVHFETLEHAQHVVAVAFDPDFSEPLPEFVFAFQRLDAFLFVEGRPNFGPGAGGHHVLQPVLFGDLLAGGDDLDLVAAAQRLTQRDKFVVHLGANALRPHFGVDAEGKVQRGGAGRQGDQVSCWREDVDFF